jgi:hypothetical protein
MGGGVDDWSILNVDQETDPIIYWQEGTLFFDNAPEVYTDLGTYADLYAQGGSDLAFTLFPQVCQEIEGNFFEGDTLHLEFDYDISDGEVEVYYRGVDNNPIGFRVFIEGPAFGTFSEDIVLESTIGTSMQTIAYVRGNLGVKSNSANGFTGSIDNISLTRVVHNVATPQTVSFSEDVKGWVSFKSFIPQSGLSLSNQYFTINNGGLYQHNIGAARNIFYGQLYSSIIETVFNAEPSLIKDFNTINYEGSQARIMPYSTQVVEDIDGNQTTISNLSTHNALTETQRGWFSSSIYTDYETGSIQEFIEKEGKWFNYIRGTNTPDVSNFNFQGLGIVSDVYVPNDNTAE